jgi:ABC-type cobalamin/Fe3+-siderophores transport system ATPase subunit
MKKAALSDHWRKLPEAVKAAKGITRLEQNLDGKTTTLNADGVVAVVGANGSGKSSFFKFLKNVDYKQLPFSNHKVTLHEGTTVDIPGGSITATIVDPFAELLQSNEMLLGLSSTFGQQDLNILKDKELGLLNFVIGSVYSQIGIEEILVGDDDFRPRFVVLLGELELDNTSLSLGEQLVLYIYWALTRKYRDAGVYFIEEPESGLAPAAQLRLADLLVYISTEKGKQIFIATHSPFLVLRLGKDRVLLMKNDGQAKWINANQSNYLEELGMDLGLSGIFYVEDNKAKLFFEKLLDIYGSDLRKTHEIVFLDGESNVFEVIKRVANKGEKIKVCAVLDADQRKEDKYTTFRKNILFLPGTQSPEQEVIKAITQHQNEFARMLAVNTTSLQNAMRRCQGYNHHDYFEELSKNLYGVPNAKVYESAFIVWFANYPDRSEVHELMQSIDTQLGAESISEVDELYPTATKLAVAQPEIVYAKNGFNLKKFFGISC